MKWELLCVLGLLAVIFVSGCTNTGRHQENRTKIVEGVEFTEEDSIIIDGLEVSYDITGYRLSIIQTNIGNRILYCVFADQGVLFIDDDYETVGPKTPESSLNDLQTLDYNVAEVSMPTSFIENSTYIMVAFQPYYYYYDNGEKHDIRNIFGFSIPSERIALYNITLPIPPEDLPSGWVLERCQKYEHPHGGCSYRNGEYNLMVWSYGRPKYGIKMSYNESEFIGQENKLSALRARERALEIMQEFSDGGVENVVFKEEDCKIYIPGAGLMNC